MLPPSSAAWAMPGLKRVDKEKLSPLELCPLLLVEVCKLYGYKVEQLHEGKKREIGKAYAKHIFFFFIRDYFPHKDVPLKQIAAAFGDDCDHTTVMHGVQKIKDLLATDQLLPPRTKTKHNYKTVKEDYLFTKQRLIKWLMKRQGETLPPPDPQLSLAYPEE